MADSDRSRFPWLAGALLAFVACGAGAADTAEIFDLARTPTRVFTDNDGLPDNTIFDVDVDAKGYLWVATENGPAFYDGRRWRTLELPSTVSSRFVRAILAASDGSIWLAMDESGVLRWSSGTWTVFDSAHGLPSDNAFEVAEQRLADGRNAVWASTRGALVRFEGDAWTILDAAAGLHDNRITRIVPSRDGKSVWLGTFSGVTRLVDGRVDPGVLEAPGALRSGVSGLREVVAPDGTASVWAAYMDSRIAEYADGRWRELAVPTGRPFALQVDDAGPSPTIWVGTFGEGLLRHRDGKWNTFDSQWGLPSDVIRSLHQTTSPEGRKTLWVGTQGGGLVRLSLDGWRAIDRRGGLPSNYVGPIEETHDGDGRWSIWIATNRGISRLRDGRLTHVSAADGVPAGEVYDMISERLPDGTDALWASIGTTLVRHVGGEWTAWPHPDGTLALNAGIAIDDEGAIWTGGLSAGLVRLPPDRGTLQRFEPERFDRVELLQGTPGPDGRPLLWVDTPTSLLRREGGRWIDPAVPALTPIAVMTALQLTWDDADGRRLWIGGRGSGGPYYVDIDRPGAQWVDLSATVRDLPDSIIEFERAANGDLYVFSTRGIVQLSPRRPTPEDPATYASLTFTTNDGLPSDRVNYNGNLIDHEGRVWASTLNGVAWFDPARYVHDRTPKPLYVDRAVLPDRSALKPGAVLAHDANSVRFELALLSTFREEESTFRTELQGFDRESTAWGREAHRVVTNLPAGDYVFRAWGRDWAGNVSGPVELPFRIEPAPWNWWGAYVLYALTAVLLVFAFVRHRTKVLRRETEVLEARVEARTAELKASEERALEASRAKGSFLANMSHELRTPLNAILGFTQLMVREGGRSERDRQRLATLNRSGEHLLGLINDVLSLARIESGQTDLHPATFDLPACIRQIEEMFRLRADDKGLKLIVAVDPAVPRFVHGDEGKLRQILINLVGNAIKFTSAGSVSLTADWRGGRAVFVVTDTGPGIAAEDRDVVFQAFGQTRTGRRSTEGAGLGLSICAGFVAVMGGSIDVESSPGSGSCFRVELDLPERSEGGAPAQTRRVVGIASGDRRRVLVVDDIAENREVLAALLSSVGLDVRSADDGEQAVALWRAWRPDAVFMDVFMPQLDGIASTREIRRLEGESGLKERATLVIAVSASAFDHDRAAVLAAGADDFVAKPVVERDVWEVLGRGLGLTFVHEIESAGADAGLAPRSADALPDDWRDAFRAALTRGDLAEATRLVGTLDAAHHDVASALATQLQAFELDALLEWVGAQPA